MTLLEKIKLSLFYDGLTKKEYASLEPYILIENNRRLKVYNIVALVFVSIVFFYSLFTAGLIIKTFVYLACAMGNLFSILMLYSKVQNKSIVGKFLTYFFVSLMLLFTVFLGTVLDAGLPATTFFAALVLIPYITYEKALYGFIHRLIILLIFFFVSYKTKNYEYFKTDLTVGIGVFLLSSLAGVRVQRIQVSGWVRSNNMNKEITKMSGIFESITVIDLTKNTLSSYSLDSDRKHTLNEKAVNASVEMDKYVEEQVCENNKIHMRQFCDLSTLEDRMFSEKILICDYATTDITWRRATFVSIEENSKGFTTKVMFTVQRIADSFYLNMLDFDLNKIK